MRRELLVGEDQKPKILEEIEGILNTFVDMRMPEKVHASQWDWHGLETDILNQFGVKIHPENLQNLGRRAAEDDILQQLTKRYDEKEQLISPEMMREMERVIMLNVIDNQWKDHLLSMDHLKEGIGMRAYGQKDPLIEYKKESYVLFQDMMDRIEDETIRFLYFMQRDDSRSADGAPNNIPHPELWAEEPDEDEAETVGVGAVSAISEDTSRQLAAKQAAQNSVLDLTRTIQRKKEREMAALQFAGGESTTVAQPVIAKEKAGRNDPCPCGSGKKYKKCHGVS